MTPCATCFGYGHLGKPLNTPCTKCDGTGFKNNTKAKRKHEEANLHLSFANWLKKEYPEVMFVRHEKERKRNGFLSSLMEKYNSLGGLPDFECLHNVRGLYGPFFGLYIEFKKPNEKWLEATGYVKKAYTHQYLCHKHLWNVGRCAYFCNDLETAKKLFADYITGFPQPQQVYQYHDLHKIANDKADTFFKIKEV